MRFKFKSKKLEALYTEEKDAHKYGVAVVDAFFDVMAVIEAATNELDLYQLKSLHYKKLKGKLQHLHSLRLTRQFRLIVERKKDAQGRWLLIINIDPHRYR